jgi:hypothetical protein
VGNVALGVVLSAPSNAVKDQLVAAETTRLAESKLGARVVKVTVDFGKAGSVTPEDRSNGVTQIRCYTAHTTFSEAEAVCEASLRHGVLALVDGQWDYDMYDAAGLDAWFEHDCAVGDVPLHVAPAVPCFTPAPAP